MNNMRPLSGPVDNKDREDQQKAQTVRWIRIVAPTALAVGVLLFCCAFIYFMAIPRNMTSLTTTQTVTPVSTPDAPATSMPDVVLVEYQLVITGATGLVPIQFWFVDDMSKGVEVKTQSISSTRPFTTTIELPVGEHLEISGVIANGSEGELTCRILVNGVLIEQSRGQSSGAGVHCSGNTLEN